MVKNIQENSLKEIRESLMISKAELDDLFRFKKINKNPLKEIRESLMISKAELARKADISALTITRIEQGKPCRIETQRRILLALGLKLSDRDKVFH